MSNQPLLKRGSLTSSGCLCNIVHAFFCINIIGALTREKTDRNKSCSLSLAMESYLPRQAGAQGRAANLSTRLEERI